MGWLACRFMVHDWFYCSELSVTRDNQVTAMHTNRSRECFRCGVLKDGWGRGR